MLRASGAGETVVSSYGAIHEMELGPDEKYTMDTGQLVAFSEGIGFRVRTIGGVKSTMFGGEGLVVDLSGPRRVLLQSRSTGQFLAWLIPQLPFERKGQGDWVTRLRARRPHGASLPAAATGASCPNRASDPVLSVPPFP